MLTWIKLPFFALHLLFLNSLTALSFLWIKLQKYNLIILLYCFLFIQAIFLITQDSPSLPEQKFNPKKYNQVISTKLNLEGLNQYQFREIEAKQTILEQELKQQKKHLEKQPLHRDLLINQAILELALGNKQAFENSLNKAQKVDPNWAGFSD